ncbi:hypothetical protein ASC66_12280 [Leifsonia sp. Root4]|uniref:DUF1801 domain-containing protein n=1 Tax=Leifsonia sp. Root4 TaxID=1736525 RepID=UPI0006FC0FF2|nr:DUF1801 domain-containing protein [Leifsonia sp. Root4]KQW05734.1 hypothetical protein ASC66_12280 [Leifsonia sp. Root4]
MSTDPSNSESAALEYVAAVANTLRRRDAQTLLELFGRITGESPVLWGPSIVGFGQYHYTYASGREGDAPAAGFSPRKAAMSIYLADGIGAHEDALARLGAFTSGVGCLYIKDLDTVDLAVLESIVRASYATLTAGDYGLRARESGE